MNNFFIAGCQRSGTTLVRLILESHSAVYCFDETEGYKLLSTNQHQQVKLKNKKLIGFKIPRFSEQLLWTTMADRDYGEFPSFYHKEPIIFMIRDYRDVVYSMIQLQYSDGESWLRKYGRQILRFQSTLQGFSPEDKKAFTVIEQSGSPDHLVGALYWKYKTDALFSLLEAGVPILAVSYEHLVNNPQSELEKMVSFLGLQWENSLLEHNKLAHAELEEDGMAIGGTNPKLPIHKNSLKSSEDFFSPQELKDMRSIVQNTLENLSSLNISF